MPNYALQCPAPKCLHKWETFARARERDGLCCPKCGAKAETDFEKTTVKPERSWDDREGTSRTLSFDRRAIKQLKEEMPSAEFNDDGDMVFKSNSHQRKVFREMAKARQQYRDEDRARQDRRKATDDDIQQAAKAIRGKYTNV